MTCMTVVTRYLGATNSRGSRIKATSDHGSVTLPYEHALNADANHETAARALAAKVFPASTVAVDGLLPRGTGRVFLFQF